MSKRSMIWVVWILLGLGFTACTLPQRAAVPPVEIEGGNQTWFDAPLNGTMIPLAPYEVVLHAYAESGVDQVELEANGAHLAALTNPSINGRLATFKYIWRPVSPGNYTLRARAQSAGGGWGGYATTSITFTDFTITPTFTYTPTITLTATITPTFTSTPRGATSQGFNRTVSGNNFYYGGCNPDAITVKVQASDPGAVAVVLFQKLQGVTSWDSGTSMHAEGDGLFTLTVSANTVPGREETGRALWQHQLVATDGSGEVVARSQAYNDVTLNACGGAVPESAGETGPEEPQQPIIPVRPTTVPTIVR